VSKVRTARATATKRPNPCAECAAACCRHVAVPIDTPETRGDFDDIRWYLAHRRVSVFVEDGDWYVCFHSTCEMLDQASRCRIYDRRPRICRKYSVLTCEFRGEGEAHDLCFETPAEIEAYAKLKLKRPRYRVNRSARRKRGRP